MAYPGVIRSPFLRLCIVASVLVVVALYTTIEFLHSFDALVGPQATQRVVRDMDQVRLPRLYLCPADRSRSAPLRWHSYECGLSYKEESVSCSAWLQQYRGWSPSSFGGHAGGGGGECLEFNTNDTGIRKEWSAAWNEITLRAAFDAWSGSSHSVGATDVLREVEIGYLPEEWRSPSGEISADKGAYYPLLRVPFFLLSPGGREGAGVATRTFISEELDRGRRYSGKYWYTYGNTQVSVEDPSLPRFALYNEGSLEHTASDPLGIVHVILTIEDFARFEFEVVSAWYPFLGAAGQIAGAWSLLACVLRGFLPGRPRTIASLGEQGSDLDFGGEDEDEVEARATSAGRYAQLATDEDPSAAEALIGGGQKAVVSADYDEENL